MKRAIALTAGMLACSALHAHECSTPQWPLVKPYLHEYRVVHDGRTFFAYFYGDAERNGLAAAGLRDHPLKEFVRSVIAADYSRHKIEYEVRGAIASATANARKGDYAADYQSALWRVFLEDPRYTCRLEAEFIARDGMNAPLSSCPGPEALVSDALAVYSDLAREIKSVLLGKSCCGSNSLTAFARIPIPADALLAADVYEFVQGVNLDEPPTQAQLTRYLTERGWRLSPLPTESETPTAR